jgi:uncharacterized protein with GYD domain
MATYILLVNWTEKGVKELKESPARLDKSKALAKSLGGELKSLFLTMGSYDLVAILDLPNDEAAAKFALSSAAGGHIRTHTLKAFDEASYRKIVGSV